MEPLELIKTRRSTRKYKESAVEEEKLSKVLEAGRYAPSGGNSQSTHFIVIKNKEILDELAVLVKEAFASMEITEGMYRSMVSSIMQSKSGNYVFHYNAPILIVTANQKDYGNNIADCSCAMENMMIMANALDLGSCWINQLKWLNENETLLAYMRKLGLKENERIYASLALGYANSEDGLPDRNPLPRKGNDVTIIE